MGPIDRRTRRLFRRSVVPYETLCACNERIYRRGSTCGRRGALEARQFATTPAAVELFSSHAFLPELHSTGAVVAPPAAPGDPGTPPMATSSTTVVKLSGARPRDRTITEPLVSTVNLPRRQSAVSFRIQTVYVPMVA